MSQPKASGLAQLIEGFNRLSERERALVIVFALLFIFIGGFFGWQQLQGQLTTLAEENEQLKSSLATIEEGKADYLQIRSQVEAQRRLLEANQVDLSRLMESAAGRQGFSIEDFRANRRFLEDNQRRGRRGRNNTQRRARKVLVQHSQTVTIRNISLEKLSAFLEELERNRFPIRVNKLDIRTSARDRQQLIEVRLTVSTYKSEEEEA